MPDKDRVERFLRTLLGVLTVASVVLALVSPPDPLVFTALLVPAWLAGAAVAAWLVYREGWAYLHASDLYAPRLPAATATLLFAGLAIALKVAGTAGANRLLGQPQVGYGAGVVTSLVAVAVAYAFAFWANEYLRTFLGTLSVATAVASTLRSGPDSLAVLAGTVGVLAAPLVTLWLVRAGGYDRLRASQWYRPRAPAPEATTGFVLLLVALDVATMLAVRVLVRLAGPLAAGTRSTLLLFASLLALVGAYWVVYRAGAVGLARTWYARDVDSPGDPEATPDTAEDTPDPQDHERAGDPQDHQDP